MILVRKREKPRRLLLFLFWFEVSKTSIGFRVVFVFVDAPAIGFLIELVLGLLGQIAIVFRHIFLFVALQALFAAFQALRLPRGELAAYRAVGDAGLLSRLMAIHLIDARMFGIDLDGAGGVALLRGSGSDEHQATRRKNLRATS